MNIEKNKKILKNINKILELSEYNLKKNSFVKRKDAGKKYLEEAKNEIEETLEEYKKDNKIYLEDELGDIFWDFIQALKILKRDGYIYSVEKVFEHSFLKYEERMSIFDEEKYFFDNFEKSTEIERWNIVKEKQKKVLEENNFKKYKK